AFVIGTASKENIDFVKQLGADKVIDYKNEKFEDKVKDVDLVIDLVGGDVQKRSLKVIKKGGTLVTTVQPQNQEAAKEKNINVEGFMAQSVPEELEQIKQLIDSGKVKPVVSAIMPLKDAAKAQELSEDGHPRGKIVLQVVA
ncbi:MAG: zinc-binding dehydrogenase, partial [Ginsengibacter sp.]